MSGIERCNGEIDSVGVSKITDPIGAGMEYNSHCLTCKRWAGRGSTGAADMQNFVSVKFIADTETRWLCVNRL